MKMNRKGFTLVEIMIVVAIIGILAAIAIPNFIKSRKESQKNACLANMKQIFGAAEQWKLAGNAGTPKVSDLYKADSTGFLKVNPKCPLATAAGDASYTITTETIDTSSTVTCLGVDGVANGHVLP